ncbi:MAG: hypothetical protein LBB22_05095 [Treponema sp.]|nr:hypothetical protein [Treponema sp.]
MEFIRVDTSNEPIKDEDGDIFVSRTDINDNKNIPSSSGIVLVVQNETSGITLETLSKIGKTGYLYNFLEDIDLNDWYGKDGHPEYWEPIEYTADTGIPFNGNNTTISNLRLKGGDVRYSGFFSSVGRRIWGTPITIELDPEWTVTLTGNKEQVDIGGFAGFVDRSKYCEAVTVKGKLNIVDDRGTPDYAIIGSQSVLNVGGVVGDVLSFKNNAQRYPENSFEGGNGFVDITVETKADDVRVGGFAGSYRGQMYWGYTTRVKSDITVNANSTTTRVGAFIGLAGNPNYSYEFGRIQKGIVEGAIIVNNDKENSVNYVSGLVAYISAPELVTNGMNITGPLINENISYVKSIELNTAVGAVNHVARILAGYEKIEDDGALRSEPTRLVSDADSDGDPKKRLNKAYSGMTVTVNGETASFAPTGITNINELFNGVDIAESEPVVELPEETETPIEETI